MNTIELDHWSDFADAVAQVRSKYGTRTIQDREGHSISVSNEIVFRGHADANWKLETTLERTTDQRYSVSSYLQRADSVVNEIESITKYSWRIPSFPIICEEVQKNSDSFHAHVPCYEYLVYLRHHGFPSPLLDWTQSPYIAAFFALEGQCDSDKAAVIVFVDSPDGGKVHTEGDVLIRLMGPYVTTHARHFAQKASYTIATTWDRELGRHHFCSHEDAKDPSWNPQDVLIKISFPRVDRILALKQLNDYNINHFTLFQTDDSLIRSLGQRAFELQ